MKPIEIARIRFEKFNFLVKKNDSAKSDGKAELEFSQLDMPKESPLQTFKVNISINYVDKSYEVETRMEGIFRMKKEDVPEDIFDNEKIQKRLIEPMIDKLRLHIGLVSEGIDGAVKLPNFNFTDSPTGSKN